MKTTMLGALVAGFSLCAWADGDAASEEESSAPVDEAVARAQQAKTREERVFYTLPICRRVEGVCEVMKPGATAWEAAEEGRYYPLGSSFRTGAQGGALTVAFGKTCSAKIENGASFATRPQKLSDGTRTIVPTGGDVTLSLPSTLKPGLMFVTTSCWTAKNLCGESKFSYRDTGDGSVADIQCLTGQLSVEGAHYLIPQMHAADRVRIRSTQDELETILYGTSGDYVVQLDQGVRFVTEAKDDGTFEEVSVPSTLDFHLSVDTRVQINRAVPSVGSRMSVTMMTFDSMGQLKNQFAYAEGRPEVNTGELVVTMSKEATSAAQRAAAEATTDEAAEVEEDEAVVEDETSSESASDEEESASDDTTDDDSYDEF